MRTTTVLSVLCCAALSVRAQPSIRAASVVNAASNLAPTLPNAGLAQGGMFILKGRNLGAKGTVLASAFPLQTTMGGTSIKITVGSTFMNVPVVYVVGGLPADTIGPFDQVAGLVPSTMPTGTGTITVTYNNQTSPPAPVTIQANQFGIFAIGQNGTGPGVFTDPNYNVITLVNAAHAGDQLFIWGTGLGAISGDDAGAPPVGNLNVPAEVYVGGVKAAIGYQGRSGCCAGIDQILITVPAGVQGCYVPVVVKTGSAVSNFVSMAIAPSGASVCSDPGGFSASELQNSATRAGLGVISVSRFNAKFNFANLTAQGNIDQGSGRFYKYSANQILGAPRGGLAISAVIPSTGCSVFPFPVEDQGALLSNLINDPDGFNGADPAHGMDAGPALNFTGPLGNKQILRLNNGGDFRYDLPGDQLFGGGLPPAIPASPEYLVPGTYTVANGGGGPDVGPFNLSLTIPNTSNPWVNQDAVSNIPRAQDLTLAVTPPASGLVSALIGSSADPAKGWGVTFACMIPDGATSFTVPSYVLSVLPASGVAPDVAGAREGFLAVGMTLASPIHFQTSGIDAGIFSWGEIFLKNVNFQ